MHLKEQSVKKQAISRYYFSLASIQSSKESFNYKKIVCIAGVIDTGNAPEKSNISANIRKKSKSFLGLSAGARRSCLKKKTRGEKSGGTVPLSWYGELIIVELFLFAGLNMYIVNFYYSIFEAKYC
jgi:hypothetical protein